MPYTYSNLALVDDRLGFAWTWFGQSRTVRRSPGELGLINCVISRTGGVPVPTWRTAGNVHQALPLLTIAATQDENGVLRPGTELDQLAVALWRDGDGFGYLIRVQKVYWAALSRSQGMFAFYPEDPSAASVVPRRETFAQILDDLTDLYPVDQPAAEGVLVSR